jgi:predicted porin
MKSRTMRVALVLGCAILALLANQAIADETSDMKAEIEAQRTLIEAQRARLDALEKKLDATVRAQEAAAARSAVAVAPGPPPVPVAKAMTTDQNGVPLPPYTNDVMLYNDANTSLRIYGLLEATISRVNHQTLTGGDATGYQVAWFSGNRLGFDADHAVGFGDQIGLPNLKVISKLETEVELPTGNMDTANVFFNRDAWVGFYSDDLGKLTFGRQNTLTRDFTQNWGDPYGSQYVVLKEGGYSNVNNFKQLIFYSAGPNGTRMNSGIVWKKIWGDDQHWVTGLAYNFGSGANGGSGDVGSGGSTPGDFTKGTSFAASVAYNGLALGPGRLSVNASYDRANVADLIQQSELFGGNYVIGNFRLNAGFAHFTAQQGPGNSIGTRTDRPWTVSMSVLPWGGKTEFAIGYQQMKGDHAGFNSAGRTLNPFGSTAGVTTVASGGKNTVYGSIMYHADRQLDLYIAADYFRTTGQWVVGDALGNGLSYGGPNMYNNETEVAVGARYKF